jgi:hypothetical protein
MTVVMEQRWCLERKSGFGLRRDDGRKGAIHVIVMSGVFSALAQSRRPGR